jgi:nucleoside phosphorylase/CheY-like chemotaxis protein
MMKIIIVEDDNNKLRNIVKALKQVPECRLENIHQSATANEAKRLLAQNEYDLLVLDVSLPDRADELPTPDGGIKLLQEILDRDAKYYRPKHIVGLTAFPEILTKVVDRFAEDLWMIIQYDPTSEQWADQLRRKVEYILLAERSHPIPDYGVYLGIVTALNSPELAAVLDYLPWDWTPTDIPGDSSRYFKGRFTKGGESREVVAVAAPRMGMTASAVVSIKLIASFRPRYLAMVGIAAGIEGRCKIGDVIVADPSWDWGSGKIASGRSKSDFQQAPYQVAVDSFVRAKLDVFERDGAALDSIRRLWKSSSIEQVLRLRVGPVASGAAVLADKKTTRQIMKQHRKLLAVEMETYGVYAAAQEASLPQPKVFSMKSICDYADEKKGDEYQAYAAFTSAHALRVFVETFL